MNSASNDDTSGPGLIDAIRHALQPSAILRSLLASTIIWLLMASAMPSYSRLIFNGELAGYFAAGLGIVLVSEIAVALITSLFSSDHATLAVPQSPTAVIQGIIAASVIAAAPADMPEEALFATVFIAIALSSILTGAMLFLLGYAGAGGLIRYIPYPIVGGFMAGLGWLILNAGFKILVNYGISAETAPILLESEVFARWLPAAIFALAILGLRTRIKSTMIMPGCIIAAFILFYVWAYVGLGDVSIARAEGWFLPDVSGAVTWQLPDLSGISQINLSMIGASAGGMLSLFIVYALNLFFRASAQELVVNRELNINRECAVNGVANIAAGFCGGGVVAYHAPISSSLVHNMRVNGRLVGVILSLMFILTLLFGSSLFSLVPRFIPAGLLMYFGLQFMKEWLYDSWFSLPRREYAVIAVIALVTGLFGLLTGIAVGIAVAITFFVLEYSRMNVIKQEFSGALHRSNLDRSFAQNQLLQNEGDKILIMRLQGFIFFGTAYRFYEHVKLRVTERETRSLRYLILDFKAVRDFDFSTIHDFKKLKRLTDRHDIELLLSNVLPHLQPVLQNAGIAQRETGASALFNDLDHALEWCENNLLEAASLIDSTRVTLERQLADHTRIGEDVLQILPQYLERMETEVGQTIFSQGDESNALYFLESGRVDVLLQVDEGHELRLRSMAAGAMIGEVGFYLGSARSASIVVTEAGVLQRLSHEALRKMEETAPQTASAIHVLIASLLSDRLSTTNRLVQELMD